LNRKVVVTGVGAVTPLGVGAPTLHERWARGECGIVDGAGACTDFEPEEHLSVKEIRRLDRFSQLVVVAAGEALAQAAWQEELPYEPFRTACVIATGIGGLETLEAQRDVMRERGAKMVSPLGIPQYMPNAGAAAVAMKHGLRGQTYGVVSACSSGAHAVGSAMRMIQYGDADAVITGGAESTLTPFAFACFNSMQALSPTGVSRPFDARRDGFVMGEGAGVLVLEEESAARERGATILAQAAGYGSTSDAYHLTAPEPTGTAAAKAIELALDDAGVSAQNVCYVNAHGTSTQLNDAAETAALKSALGVEQAKRIPISSTKSTVETLMTGVIPPTVGYEVPDPELDLDYVPGEARPLTPSNGAGPVAISNSFAFGGHNVTLVLRRGSE
jgi:3-oxoacyl-[acyl-carrier-protein] synthase II